MLTSVALLLLITTANANRYASGWEGTLRARRSTPHLIKDCVTAISDAGHYYYKSMTEDTKACGIYIMAEPDQLIEIFFEYLNVPCNTGGLVAVVDGWEMGGGFFPRPEDDGRQLSDRVTEFCGPVRPSRVFISSQNAALIQYRVPNRGKGFSFVMAFVKNPTPCNVLLSGSTEVYTLRNYGKPSNCSLTAVLPLKLSVLSLGVGVSITNTNRQVETGTIHRCQDKGLMDFVEIGGGDDLGLNKMSVQDSICGVDSIPGRVAETLLCGVSTVKLVSSGNFDNSVTVFVQEATEDDFDKATLICP